MNIPIEDKARHELIEAIMDGRTFSCNGSPTCQAKIIGLQGGIARLQVVTHPSSYMSEYNVRHETKIGTKFNLPAQYAHNAIYF